MLPVVPRARLCVRILLSALAAGGLAACTGGAAVVSNPSPNQGGGDPPPVGNRPPSISGTPATAGRVGDAYQFRPSASDPDGNVLTFSASGLPGWAHLDPATGLLSGTPAASDAGIHSGIVLRVNDGSLTQSLPAFSITVEAAGSGPGTGTGTGTAMLSWQSPVENTDGTPLNDLAGYRIYSGRTAGSLTLVATLASTAITTYGFRDLAAGTHYFAISAYSAVGAESALSALASKTIP